MPFGHMLIIQKLFQNIIAKSKKVKFTLVNFVEDSSWQSKYFLQCKVTPVTPLKESKLSMIIKPIFDTDSKLL